MNAKRFLWGALFPLATAVTSCSNDLGLEGGNEIAEIDQTQYVTVAIASNGGMGTRADGDNYYNEGTDKNFDGTKAPNFEVGEAQESKVQQVYFVFFDADGNFISSKMLTNSDLTQGTDESGVGGNNDWTYVYKGVVPYDVKAGQAKPTQMLCYVNPASSSGLDKSLAEIETTARSSFFGQEKDNAGNNVFAMSNSVYYAADGSLVRTTPITGKVFDSQDAANNALKDDASAADKAKIVDIYVERYASKVKFSVETAAGNNNILLANPKGDPAAADAVTFSLKFTPKAWDVTGTDKTVYVSKSFRLQAENGQLLGTNATYAQVNGVLNPTGSNRGWMWNDPTNFRSYWERTPAYFSTQYPQVADDYKGNANNYLTSFKTQQEILSNGSYNADGTIAKSYAYFNPTTTGQIGLTSVNPAASIPYAVLTGNYTIMKKVGTGTATALTGNQTFYVVKTSTQNNIYFPYNTTGAQIGESTVEDGQSIMEYLLGQNYAIKVRYGAGTTADPYTIESLTPAQAAGIFDVTHPGSAALDGAKLAARRVLLQFKTNGLSTGDNNQVQVTQDTKTGIVVCQNGEAGTYVPVVTTGTIATGSMTTADVNKILVKQIGTNAPIAFTNGAAWYYIPIRHFGWYTAGNQNLNQTTINWKNVRIGDFGLVRNHVYTINVTAINGLGIGILDPNDPIIPPADVETNAVAYRMRILNWAVVPTQNVIL